MNNTGHFDSSYEWHTMTYDTGCTVFIHMYNATNLLMKYEWMALSVWIKNQCY